MIAPGQEGILRAKGFHRWTTVIDNVQELIDAEAEAQRAARERVMTRTTPSHVMEWESYHTTEEIHEWMRYLEGEFFC